MFSRRTPRTRGQKFRESVWPSMGLYRLVVYYQHRMGRMKETPRAVAAGFASGFAIAFTPFIGFHLMLGALVTWIARGSFIAMVLGSVVAGNFWTYPFIFVGTYRLGKFFMGAAAPEHPTLKFTWEFLLAKPMDYLLPMMLGSVPFVLLSWALSFFIVRRVVMGYKVTRRIKEKK